MTLLQDRFGGSSVYARALLAALEERSDVSIEVINAPTSGLFSTAKWMLSGARKRTIETGASVLHCPAFLAPLKSPVPLVLTVHDLSPQQMPAGQSLEWRAYLDLVFPHLARRSAAIVTPTETTRQDVIQSLAIPEDRVVTTPYGIESHFFAGKRRDRSIGSEQPLILFPSPPIGRKNLDLILKVMGSALPGSAVSRARLEISGAAADDFPHYRRSIAESALASRVSWLGRVPSEEMPALYRRADVVVYPSFLEGFGFPPLEAMAAGTPVVASNASCLPEVMGDGGLLVDPNDEAGFRAAIESVLTSSVLRRRLIKLGASRARNFTWSRCAEMVATVYQMVARR